MKVRKVSSPLALEVRSLFASSGGKEILKGIDLKVGKGEIHLIMGPNGSGKSTLAMALLAHPKYSVSRGKILLWGKDISGLSTDERSKAGLFLALQHPTEVSGVRLSGFLRAAINARRSEKDPVRLADFKRQVEEESKKVGILVSFLDRDLNVGFSGGEKKRAEVLQALLLKPKVAIFDETDSGLDLDSLKAVATAIEKMRSKEFSAVVITHNPRVLKYISPDRIHILSGGRIVRSGNRELAENLEIDGYAQIVASSGKVRK